MSDERTPEAITVFHCGGDCPKGGEHKWDGEGITWETPGAGGAATSTCSKCGLAAIDYDMMNAD